MNRVRPWCQLRRVCGVVLWLLGLLIRTVLFLLRKLDAVLGGLPAVVTEIDRRIPLATDREITKWTTGRWARVPTKDLPDRGRRARLAGNIAWVISVALVATVPTAMAANAVANSQVPAVCMGPSHPWATAGDFDASSASDADLACMGIPSRPKNTQRLAVWNATWGTIRHVLGQPIWAQSPASEALAEPPAVAQPGVEGPQAPSLGYNWVGYVASSDENNNATFLEAGGEWNVPSAPDSTQLAPNNGTLVAAWAGLGGYGIQDLIQAGTMTFPGDDAGDKAQYKWFWEDYPQYAVENVCVQNCPDIYPGANVFVSVLNLGSGLTQVSFGNPTTNQWAGGLVPTPDYDQTNSSAEILFEDQHDNNGNTIAWPFSPVTFSQMTTDTPATTGTCSCDGTTQSTGLNVELFDQWNLGDPLQWDYHTCAGPMDYDQNQYQVVQTTAQCWS